MNISLALVVFSIISCVSGQGCGSQTFDFPPDVIRITAPDFTQLQVKFGLGGKLGITVNGGAGLSIGDNLTISSFGDLNPPGQSSGACQSRSSSLFSYFFMALATFGFMGMRRVEGWVVIVACLSLFAYEATSACSVTMVVNGREYLQFEGDITAKITVTCEAGGDGVNEYIQGVTLVGCPYGATFARAYSSPSNDASCASLAPASVTVRTESVFNASLRINEIPAVSAYNYTLQESIFDGPLAGSSLFPNVRVVGSGPVFDMLLDGVDIGNGRGSGIFPVMIRKEGAKTCKFGYKCSGGSCLGYMSSKANTCVEYGYEPPSAQCVARGNGTGMSCGQNCTQFSCLAMCPNFDCSKSRSCEISDTAVPYCHSCQCMAPAPSPFGGVDCYREANTGMSVVPGLWALFVLGVTVLLA